MGLFPVPGNVDAPADPDAFVRLNVIQKLLQGDDAARSPKQSAVHADAHHLGLIQSLRIPLCIEQIKTVLQLLKKRIGV